MVFGILIYKPKSIYNIQNENVKVNMEYKRVIVLFFCVLNIRCAIKDERIKTFDEIRFEMLQDPFIFYIYTYYYDCIRIMVYKKMIDDLFKSFPISEINEVECDLNFFKEHYLTDPIGSDITLYKFFKYFKPKTWEIWSEMFKYRVIYVIFDFFRDYLSEYSVLFNEHPLFRAKTMSFMENSYLKKLEGKGYIKSYGVKELEILIKINTETCDDVTTVLCTDQNTNDISIEDSQVPESNAQSINTPPENSIFKNKTEADSGILPQKQDQTELFSDETTLREISHQNISNPLISSSADVACDKAYKFILLDSLETLFFGVIGFFKKNILHNNHKLLYNFDYTSYKNSNLFETHKNLLKQDTNAKSKSIIFAFFYKKMYGDYQSYLNTMLSHLKEVSSNNFENLTYYFHKMLNSPVYKIGITKDLYYLAIDSKFIPQMNYDEKVLVFDLDDTLFPTTFYLSNTKDFLSSNENSDFDDSDYVSKLDVKETIEELKTIKIIDHFKKRKQLKWYLNNLPYKKICLTNASKPHAEFALKALDISECFEFVLYKGIDMKKEYMKPYKYPFKVVEILLGCDPSNIYFYDDISANCVTADQRNWNAFLINENLIETIENSLNSRNKF
ncbi:putative suppressor of disruption of TFIIS [Hamiltosporidium tvaerminnensis]|nr:putative suppressor of disruption of TFIIS [Hamiltosporidium tvaerminnensis]